MPDEPLSSDDKPIFDALRQAGGAEGLAYTAVQMIRDLAGRNVLSSLTAQMAAMRWMLAAILALLAALTALGLFNTLSRPQQPAAPVVITVPAPADAGPPAAPAGQQP